MTRLFVAAWPAAEVIDQLGDLTAVEPVDGERRVAQENWHITLRFLGNTDPAELIARLETARLPTVRADLGPEVTDLDGRQTVIPVTGVDPLADAVRRATVGLGEPDRRDFVGHLTLARTKHPATSPLLGQRFHGTFVIDSVLLVASDLRQTGPVYSTVATFATTLGLGDPSGTARRDVEPADYSKVSGSKNDPLGNGAPGIPSG